MTVCLAGGEAGLSQEKRRVWWEESETPPAAPLISVWSPGPSRAIPATAAAVAARAVPHLHPVRTEREKGEAMGWAVPAVWGRLRAQPKVGAGHRRSRRSLVMLGSLVLM